MVRGRSARVGDLTSGRIADIGVTKTMSLSEAKYIRLCNRFAAVVFVAAFFFCIIEAPLIVDWVGSTPRQWLLFALRFLMVWPFLIPILMNARHARKSARIFLPVWGILFCVFLTVFYGVVAPTHILLLAVAVLAPALFPPEENARMFVVLALALIALVLCLWLRSVNMPLMPVVRPLIQTVVEVTLTIGAFGILFMVAMTLRRTIDQTEKKFTFERERAEALLLNILPAPIATRLKESPEAIADGFDNVSVMFSDLVGFTPLSEKLTPEALVRLMDQIFSEFDQLADKHGLEKIKTIGDAYMVAGGLPSPGSGHTAAMADMALEMAPAIQAIEKRTGHPLNLRIGIARGPAVAGVIGKKKFSYDLWGDTVNTASRLESHGAPGKIHVNRAVYEKLKDAYSFEPCGLVDIKGKGPLETWYLTGKMTA